MDRFDFEDLKQLAEPRTGLCVSMYLPTHRTAPDSQRDPIGLKNLLRLGHDRLVGHGIRRSDASAWLRPAEDRLLDTEFWSRGFPYHRITVAR